MKLLESRRPVTVTYEAVIIPPGETRYWVLFEEHDLEALRKGKLPKAVVQVAKKMLDWKYGKAL